MTSENADLVIPVYLNTNTLVDLMATIEDGISFIETVMTSSDSSKTLNKGLKAGFNVNPLGMFQLGLGGHRRSENAETLGNQRISERTHTFGSMLNRLRKNLLADKIIKSIESDAEWEQIQPSDFIEARGVFVPDPMRSQIQKINRLLGVFDLFTTANKIQSGSSRKSKSSTEGASNNSNQRDIKNIKQFFEGLENNLKQDGVQTYLVGVSCIPGHTIVAPLFDEHIRDSSNTELPNATYRVLGQVTRKLNEGDNIDLLTGSAFGGFSEDMLETFIGAFREMGESGLNIDEFSTKVNYPALQITPIAVYP